jgi:hypothetical protein
LDYNDWNFIFQMAPLFSIEEKAWPTMHNIFLAMFQRSLRALRVSGISYSVKNGSDNFEAKPRLLEAFQYCVFLMKILMQIFLKRTVKMYGSIVMKVRVTMNLK